MGDSYDDKIETILVTRQRMAEQRKIQRQKELQKQLTVLGGALAALIIVIVLIFKGCSGDTTPKGKDIKETTTVAEQTTEAVEETTAEEMATEETTTAQEETTAAANGIMYTTDVLNFRTEPSTGADLIRHLEKGTEVEVISSENGWCQIKYGDHTGYVSAEFLSPTKPE